MKTARPRLPQTAAWLVFFAYLLTVGFFYIDGYRSAARGDAPLFTDFTPIYAASLQLRQEAAENLYDPQLRHQAEVAAAQAAYDHRLSPAQAYQVGFSAWMHPPVFMLFILPLAALPYLPALLGWLLLSAAPYLLAMRSILPERTAWPFALAAPPVFFNLIYGQTGFLTAGLIGLGLTQIKRQPVVAGICIGLASFKPHFGILIPLALVLGGHWKPFGIATITVLGLLVASILRFGADPWYAYIGSAQFYLQGFSAGAYDWGAMSTVLSLFRLAGSTLELAWQAQFLAAAVSLAAVAWAWSGEADEGQLRLQCAVLCCATLLALPMVYLYDLLLLVPAIGWLWHDMQERGGTGAGRIVLIAGGASLIALKPLAALFHLQAGPLLAAGFLYLSLSRLHSARKRAAGA